jgi:DNA-binding transcriptional LysR family regulator
VARQLSFAKAARTLHLTPPAVTMQVKELEAQIGLPLFEQLGKKIYLTPAGSEMLHYSRAIIQQFHEVDEAMSQLKGISGGKLNVAVISAGDYFFPRLLAEFTRRYKGVQLNLSVHNREQLLQQLSTNQTDLAVMVRPPHTTDAINEAFAPHPYVIVAAPSHPLANKRNIKLSTLANEAFIVRERGSDTWNSMEEGFAGKITNLKIAMEIQSTETIKQAVMAGIGISFLSLHTIGIELKAGLIAVPEIEDLPGLRRWYVVNTLAKTLSPAAEAFRYFIIEHGEAHLLAHDAPLLQTALPSKG